MKVVLNSISVVMKVFFGEYQNSMDGKGRMIMPAKFRDLLGERFYITKGLDKCLFVYTEEEWIKFNEKVKALPMTDEGVRRFYRFFFGSASEMEPDGQGRVLIPASLRTYGGIKKELVTIGVSNRIEIWSRENWNQYNDESNFIDNELAGRMSELGI